MVKCLTHGLSMLYGNYCYIFIENLLQKFSPCGMYKNIVNGKFDHVYKTFRLSDCGGSRTEASSVSCDNNVFDVHATTHVS